MKKSIIAVVIVVAIAVLLITIVFTRCFEEKKDSENNQNNGNGNNNNGIEPEFDVAVLVSADKKEYNSSEKVNLTLTVINHMNISFPFGDYSLGLKYVNKSKYASVSGYSTVDIPWDNISLIEIPANETIIYNNSWDITGVVSGDYIILFEIHKAISAGGHSIKHSTVSEIKIV